MNQKGVTKRALIAIKKACEKEFESINLTKVEALVKPKKSLGRIEASGRTLRRLFNGEHVRVSTIRSLITQLGLTQSIYNGKIDIKQEEEHGQTL